MARASRAWLASATLLVLAGPAHAQSHDFFLVNQADFESSAPQPKPVFARIVGTRCHGVLEATANWEQGRVLLRLQQVRCGDVEPPGLDVNKTTEAPLTCKKLVAQACQYGVLEPGAIVRF